MKWYDRAKTRLKELKLTQADLITPLGVKTRGAVGHYLSGRREPSQEQLIALTNKLKCSLDWLLTGQNNVIPIGTATTTEQALPVTVLMSGNTEPKKPPVITDEEWSSLPPKARALVEDFLTKTSNGTLSETGIKLLQNTVDELSKEK